MVAEQRLGWADGLRTLRLVHKHHPDALLILFTRHLPPQMATLAIEHDLSAHLAKSVHGFLKLPRVIHAAMGRARRLHHQEVVSRAVAHLSIGILTLSPEGMVRQASSTAPRLLGVASEEDLIGQPLGSLVAGLDASAQWQALLQGERRILEPFVPAAPTTGRPPIRVGVWRALEGADTDEPFCAVVQKARENYSPPA